MMNNYNSLGYRTGSSRLNLQEPEVVGNAPNSSGRLRTSWLVVFVLFMSLFLGQKTFAQTYFTEGFESAWFLNGNSLTAATAAGPNAPSGWIQTRLGTLTGSPGTPGTSSQRDWAVSVNSGTNLWASNTAPNSAQAPYNSTLTTLPATAFAGSGSAWFNDGWCAGSGTSGQNIRRIESPVINLSAATAPVVTFSYALYSGSCTMNLVGSLDGGLTWNTIATYSALASSAAWSSKVVVLPYMYKVANAKIGFVANNSWGSYDLFLDAVSVREGTAPANAAPITFSATAVTGNGMTVGWVDNSTNETSFNVYRSTDNINFSLVANVASTTSVATGGAYTSAQSGLLPGVTYYYKISSVAAEGESATLLSGSQATTPAVTYYWVGPASAGLWSAAANWNTNPAGGGSTRATAATTDVLIIDGAGTTAGAAVSISIDTASFSVGQFFVTSNTACTLASSAATTRTITVTGGVGDDFVVQNGSSLSLNNATNAVAFAFLGTANTGDISGTLNFAGSTSNTLTTTGGTGTLVNVSSTGVVNLGATGNSLVGSVATLNFVAGSNCNSTGATTGAAPVPLATWATTSNLTISGLTTSTTAPTNATQSYGNLIFNCPLLTTTYSYFAAGTTAVVKGDLTITAAGATAGTGIFRAVTTGTVTVNGNVNVLQGRFQSASGAGTVIANGNTTNSANGIIDCLAGTYSQRGNTFTNNGTLTGPAGTLQFLNLTGSAAQTLAGSGTVLTNIATLSMQNTAGLTITHTNPIILARVNLFQGTITNSNKITFGTGLAVNCTTQIGSAGLLTPGGSFDAAPTFNLGTGTYNVIYAQESVARTTGFEIPATRAISALTMSNSNGLTVAGGALATGTLTFSALSGGNITTSSANLLTVTGTTTASVVRTLATAYVNGPLALTLPASLVTGSTYTFPIGKGTLNTFALVNPTTNAGGTVTVMAEAFDASTGGTPSGSLASLATNRYWAASITAGSANFTSSLIQLNDTTTGLDAIAQSSTLTGTYTLTGGSGITPTATSLTSTAPASTTLPGFYVMGVKATPSLSSIAVTPSGSQCTNVARSISLLVTPGGAPITSVVLNYTVNGVAQTAVTMTNTTLNGGLIADTWTGTLPTVSPVNATVVWSVTATDSGTLFKTSGTTTYNDEPLFGTTASASSTLSTVCSGSPVTLSAVAAITGSVSLGAGASTSASAGGTMFSGSWGGHKSQYIIKASELTAAGIAPGNITSVAFEATTAFNGYEGFALNIGHTTANAASLPLITTGLTQVYSGTGTNGAYATTIGVNTLAFSTPFNWDGTSNIVLSFCWAKNPTATSTTGTTVKVDSPGFTCSAYGQKDSTLATTMCPLSAAADFGTSGTGTTRPKFTFAAKVAAAIASYSWSDGSTVVGTTNPLTVNPTASATYTVTMTTTGGCSTTASKSITVNPLPTAPTGTGSTQCGSGVPTASVASTTGATSPVFKWYANPSGGTALQTGTSTTYTTSVSGTTTFYVTEDNGTCESSPRTAVAVTVVTPPTLTATPTGASTFCGTGGTGVLTASSNDTAMTFVWSSLNTATGTVDSDVSGVLNYTVTATTTFRVTGTPVTNPSCAPIIFDYTVSVFPLPLAALTTDVNGICPGFGNANLTSNLSASSFTSTSITHAPLTAPGTATTLVSGGVINVTPNLSYGFAGDLDDSGWSGIPIGFNFNFFGTTYTNLSISTNGTVFMGTATDTDVADFSFTTLPSASEPFKMIAVLAMDNDLSGVDGGAIKYWTEGVAPNRKFIISYQAVKEYADTKYSTAQAIFYETTGLVDVHVTSSTNVDRNKLVGINNGTGTIGVLAYASGTVANATNPIATAFAYRFTPPSNYTTTWSASTNGGASFTTFATGTNLFSQTVTPSVTTIYNLSYTNQTTGCTNAPGSSQVTINLLSVVAPTGVNTTASAATFCSGGTVNFATDYVGVTTGLTYQWQSSPNGTAWTDITGATLATYTASPTAATYYRCAIASCAGTPEYTTAKQVTPATTVDSTTPGTRCGVGTVVLGATGSAGTTLNWYAAATGGTSLGTGASFTTPSIAATTSYWVDANLGGTSGSIGAVSPSVGAYGTSFTGSYEIFNVTSPVALNSVDLYPTAAGTVIVELLDSTGAVLQTSPTYTVTAGQANTTLAVVGTPVTMPVGFNIPVGTGYRLNFKSTSTATLVRNTAGATATYGPVISAITITGNSNATTGYYYNFYNWSVSTGCSSTRSEVVATVTTPPSLSLSTNTLTICAGNTSSAVTVTADPSYTSFVWSPSTGVTGTTSATFNPTVSGTYTLTASGGGCSNTATVDVTVNPLPSTITFTPTAVTKCIEENAVAISSISSGPAPAGGCLTATSGLYPSATSTATTCNGVAVTSITTAAYAGEYSNVTVSANYKYVFTSTGAGDYVTVGNSTGTTVLAAGPSPLTWFSTSAGVVRFYTHTDSSCGEESVSRTRSYTCQPSTGLPTPSEWTPQAGLFTNAGATTPYLGGLVDTVYAKPSTTTIYTATVTSAAGCPTSSTMTVTVNASIGGAANGGATVCNNASTPTLSVTGNTGSVIRWEKAVSPFTTWTPIASSATATYVGTFMTATTQFRAIVQNGTCAESASTPTTVTVNTGCSAIMTTIKSTFWNATVAPNAYIGYQSIALPLGSTITGYHVEVKNLTTNAVGIFESTATKFRLIDASPSVSSYATSFKVNVKLQINGVWQDLGIDKFVNTPALPPTANLNTYCGQTLPKIEQILYCTQVPLATKYTFEVSQSTTSGTLTATVFNTLNNFKLTDLDFNTFPVMYNKSYSVRIKITTLVDGGEVESDWSNACSVTTPLNAPAVSITSGCGLVSSNYSLIKCTSIKYATDYKFDLVSTVNSLEITRPYNYFSLSLVPGVIPGTLYTVTPSYKLYGQWYAGTSCDLTTPGTSPFGKPETVVTKQQVSSEFAVKAYPNPFAENFKLNVTSSIEGALQVKVYDMLGKLVEAKELSLSEIETLEVGNNYPSGVYNVVVSQGEKTESLRVIKR